MDSLHLVSPRPIKSVQSDRQKVTKVPSLGGNYSSNSLTNRSITGSTGQPQAQNKAILADKTKWKELRKDFSRKSLPSSESLSPTSNSSSDIKPSAMSVDNSNIVMAKRSSRKKNRKKSKRGKKNPCQTGSSEPGVSLEDHPHVGSVSGTCDDNDVDRKDGLVLPPKTVETPLLENGAELSPNKLETPLLENGACNPETLEENTSQGKGEGILEEAILAFSKKSSENCSVGAFEKQRQPKDFVVAVCDGIKDMNHTQAGFFDNFGSTDHNGMPHSFVVDPVQMRLGSIHSSRFFHSSKQSEKGSYRTNFSQPPASSFRKGSFDRKNWPNDTVDSYSKMFPRVSTVSGFRSVGSFPGRVVKENTHSVWQKVQRNGTHDSSGDSKRVPISSQHDVPEEETSLDKRSSYEFEDAKQFKDALSENWRTKSDAASNQECKFSSKTGSHAGSSNGTASLNETLCISSVAFDQNVTTSVSISPSQSESDCSTYSDVKSQTIDRSKVMQVQSPESLPNIFHNSVQQGEENIPLADSGLQNHCPGSGLQKWVPIGLKDRGSTNSAESSSVEQSDNPTSESLTTENAAEGKANADSENLVPKEGAASGDRKGEDIIQSSGSSVLEEQKNKHAPAQCSNTESGFLIVSETVADKIAEAVNRAYKLQLESEALEKASGCPLAEFERLLHYSSPVIYQPPSLICDMCSKDQFAGMSLCSHEKPNVSLESIWKWYEDLGVYGLEVSGDDYENTKRIGDDCYAYSAYFVPYLSAVQLFRKCDNYSGDANNRISSSEVFDSSQFSETSEKSSNVDHLPISREPSPKPTKEFESCLDPSPVAAKGPASIQSVESTLSNDAELLFEYFESQQPQQRRALYEKINELVSGDGVSQGQGHGHPTNLNTVKLDDLHHTSWYSVAWYPIYRIPEDTLRAAFLTFHSLGHLKRGSARFGSTSVQDSIVCPVVGLQSYNAQGECWFNPQSSIPRHMKATARDINQSKILKERLRTLEETAMLMARAVVTKGYLTSVNRHPDYEFFCSRKR